MELDYYHRRKAFRTEQYNRKHGAKMIVCVACNGSGRYDHNGSPRCGGCDGRGKCVDYRPTPKKDVR